jgi:hypothetical protein
MKNLFIYTMTAFIIFISTRPVYAYLDAGSGSMLLQLLLGGIAGLIVVLQLFWRRFLTLFGTRKQEKKSDS